MTRVYRSNRDKVFTGLIGGLSDLFRVESTLLRIIFVVSIFITGGTTLLIYLIASLVIPKEPFTHQDPFAPRDGRYDSRYGPNRDSRYGDYNRPRNDYRDNDRYSSRHSGPDYSYNGTYGSGNGTYGSGQQHPPDPDLDVMMKDIEKKALKKEIEELKKKLSKYENEKGDL